MVRSLRSLSGSGLTAAPTPRSILASRVKTRRCHHLSRQRQPSFVCDPVSNHAEARLSDAHLAAGDAAAALAHAEEALRISARTGEAWFDAELHRRLGGALLRLDRPGDAARAEEAF